MATNYKDKIKKLLALAESPNENEAREALLKARELMARHKLTEADLNDDVSSQGVKNINTGITCSKRRNPWIIDLTSVIGENYCCKGYREHKYGKQTQYIGFVGLENDVEICVFAFKYSVDCVLSKTRELTEKYTKLGYNSDYIKRLCNSYGYGFVVGVEKATQNWGDEEFNSKASKLENMLPGTFSIGYSDGTKFDLKHRLETANN